MESPVDVSVLDAEIQTPHLTTLTLRDRFSSRNAALMKHIQTTAALTSLAVTFYPGIWDDIARFSSLNTLTISPPDAHPLASLSPIHMVRNALQKLRSLKSPEAFCFFEDPEDRTLESPDESLRIPLPQLKNIILYDSAFHAGTILRYMRLLLGIELDVTTIVYGCPRFPEAAQQLSHTVPALIDTKNAPLVALSIHCLPNMGGHRIFDKLRIDGWTLAHSEPYKPGSTPQVSLAVQDSAQAVPHFFTDLPLDNAQSLLLCGIDRGFGDGLETLLQTLQDVEELVFVNCGLLWIYLLFTGNTVVPQLRTVKLIKYDLLPTSECDREPIPDPDGDEDIELVLNRTSSALTTTACIPSERFSPTNGKSFWCWTLSIASSL